MIPVSDHVLRLAWMLPLMPLGIRRRLVTVMYHGVPSAPESTMSAAVFEEHVRFLKRHFELAGPHDPPSAMGTAFRPRVLLTFDDGFRNNAEVAAPILRRYSVPAIFFVCSRHATPGKYLWFSHLRALEQSFRWNELSFGGTVYDMRPGERHQSIKRLRDLLLSLRPHPSRMYQAIEEELPPLEDFTTARERADLYEGMSAEQVGELASDPRFAIGVHTADHPFLSTCDVAETRQQIDSNRRWIERATGTRCERIAYPAGDYNAAVMDVCRELGFTKGFAVATRSDSRSPLEHSRMGIYSASTDILAFKVKWGHVLRNVRIPIG